MIKEVAQFSIRNRKVTFFLIFLIGILGIYSYIISPKQQAPDLSAPNVVISAVYPGASPEDIEHLVTKEIEDRLTSVTGYDYSHSISKDNVSLVVLYLHQDADMDKAYSEVRQKMQSLESDLPDGVQRIRVNTDLTETAGILLSISGTDYDDHELAKAAEEIKSNLNRIPGVSRFDIVGKRMYEVTVEVDLSQLKYYNLSLENISDILKAQNLEIPAGYVEDNEEKVDVKMSGYFESLEEIENTIIAVSKDNGSVARLKDIAKVKLDLSKEHYKIRRNGENAILLVGYFNQDQNVVSIGKRLDRRIEAIEKTLPDNLELSKVSFQPQEVEDLVQDFTFSLILGIILVILVVFLGMGIRNAIVVSTAIPLSVLMSLCMMYLLKIEIHQISITALIIALGMLVDNAIVVSDAIQNKVDEGMDRLYACLNGVKEVAYPVLSSTLTTVAAFVPLLMLSSTAGKYIHSIPQIIMISLTSSYIVAVAVTPMMAYLFFEKNKEKTREYFWKERFFAWAKYFIDKKKKLFSIILAVVGLTVFIGMNINMQFFPKENGNILYIDVSSEMQDIRRTENVVDQVEKILNEETEVTEYTSAIGRGLPKYYIALVSPSDAPDVAQIMMRIDLKSTGIYSRNSEYAEYLQKKMDTSIVGGKAVVRELEQGYPTLGAPVTIRLSGKDLNRLEQASRDLKQLISTIPGAKNIDDDLQAQKYEFVMKVDPNKASSLGISKYDVQREVSTALRGKESSVFRKEGNEYDIIVKGNVRTKEEIENLFVKSVYTGESVPIREVADIRLNRRWNEIVKYDREMTISVFADADRSTDPVQIQNEIERKISTIDLSQVKIAYDGERERIYENFGSMGILGMIAILLVYGILLFQFGSIVQPLIILLSIPLSVSGSVLGLFLLRQPLSFMALLGIVSLFGVVVNNAIVLIDYVNAYRKEEESLKEACLKAVRVRFRPIMLTTITTVIGLLPLVFSGSDLFRPMAISLMCGLMVSTLLTLIVIPVTYHAVEHKIIRDER